MARKILTYKVTDEGRDKGKIFVLTEMPAAQGERWALRAIHALLAGGVELPDNLDLKRASMAHMAQIGIQALSGLSWEKAEPLLSEMWECVQIQPDPKRPDIVRGLIDEDIEEIGTRLKLRMQIWGLHVDFFGDAVRSISGGSEAAGGDHTQNTQMSPW